MSGAEESPNDIQLKGNLGNSKDGSGNLLSGSSFPDSEGHRAHMLHCTLDNCSEHFPQWAAGITITCRGETQLTGTQEIIDGHVGFTDVSLVFENGVPIAGTLQHPLELKAEHMKGMGYWT
jgi:hypothetical protein